MLQALKRGAGPEEIHKQLEDQFELEGGDRPHGLHRLAASRRTGEVNADPVRATVAITGMNATDNPAPGVAVARALRREPAFQGRIIGLGYDALDPGFYMDGLLDGGAVLPYPSTGKDALLSRMRSLRDVFGIDGASRAHRSGQRA